MTISYGYKLCHHDSELVTVYVKSGGNLSFHSTSWNFCSTSSNFIEMCNYISVFWSTALFKLKIMVFTSIDVINTFLGQVQKIYFGKPVFYNTHVLGEYRGGLDPSATRMRNVSLVQTFYTPCAVGLRFVTLAYSFSYHETWFRRWSKFWWIYPSQNI